MRKVIAPFLRALRMVGRILKFALKLLALLLLLGIFIVLVFRPNYPFGVGWNAVSRAARDDIFNYIDWEIEALSAKAAETLWGQHPFLNEADRSQYVRDYMTDLARARQLEAEIAAIFTDPSSNDPQTATVTLRAERDRLRADLRRRQSLAESILEGQVATILVEEGFGLGGQLLPPMAMRFTIMPNMLITSPRDRIERGTELALDPMPIEEIVALENRLEQEQNLSALIVPLGGMALYPAMIDETDSIPRAIEVFAHEWVHQYFFFYPLGFNYFVESGAGSREALIINETVADIFAAEVTPLVLQRYYPELVISSRSCDQGKATPCPYPVAFYLPSQQSPFDYGAEMRRTRVTVDHFMTNIQLIYARADELRANGFAEKADQTLELVDYYVLKAENYLEARRVLFYENGYPIRRMNQAYFAFYGGYQGGIPGIGGEDPIGPAVRDLRASSPDLHSFIVAMRGITTRAELLATRDRRQ